MTIIELLGAFFLLLAAHFVADFALQSDTMGREKRRASKTKLQKIVPWYWWLTGHAFTHGALIFLVTGSYLVSVAETVAHWIIDFGKCEGYYGLKVDQFLHLICKLIWLSYIIHYGQNLF